MATIAMELVMLYGVKVLIVFTLSQYLDFIHLQALVTNFLGVAVSPIAILHALIICNGLQIQA